MPLYFAVLQYSFKSLNYKQGKTFKRFNITIPYPFLFIRKFGEYLFPKGVLIYQEKNNSQEYLFPRKLWLGSRYFPVNKYWGVIFKGSVYLLRHRDEVASSSFYYKESKAVLTVSRLFEHDFCQNWLKF